MHQSPRLGVKDTSRIVARLVKLTAADASQLAAAARKGVSVEMAPGLELSLWASDELIVDPVALEFDERGTLYATSSSRNNMPLDIRDHPTWVPTVHTLKTVSDLREFYRKELAPSESAKNLWLPDLNQDGSHDIRDFTEYKDRLYRVQDTNGDGIADSSRIMIEGFNADPTYDVAGGILFNEGDFLLGIAPGVFRLKDDNGEAGEPVHARYSVPGVDVKVPSTPLLATVFRPSDSILPSKV